LKFLPWSRRDGQVLQLQDQTGIGKWQNYKVAGVL